MHDSLNTSTGTVLEADFYHADQLLPQSDQDLVAKVSISSEMTTKIWSLRLALAVKRLPGFRF